jgi:hypothetical protein
LPACIFNSLEATLVHYWFNPKAEGVFAMNKHESVLLQMQKERELEGRTWLN